MNTKKEIKEKIKQIKYILIKIVEDEKDINLYSTHLIMKMCADCDYVIDQIG